MTNPVETGLNEERRNSSFWNRLRRGAARYVAAMLLLSASSVGVALFTVVTNGVRLPQRVAAMETRQKAQVDTVSLIAHQLSDTVIPLVIWQAMQTCGMLTQREMRASADKCGMAAHRSGAIFPAPFGLKP